MKDECVGAFAEIGDHHLAQFGLRIGEIVLRVVDSRIGDGVAVAILESVMAGATGRLDVVTMYIGARLQAGGIVRVENYLVVARATIHGDTAAHEYCVPPLPAEHKGGRIGHQNGFAACPAVNRPGKFAGMN